MYNIAKESRIVINVNIYMHIESMKLWILKIVSKNLATTPTGHIKKLLLSAAVTPNNFDSFIVQGRHKIITFPEAKK